MVEPMTVPALGHSYEETVITEPTCTEVGAKLRKCTVCDEETTVELPALGHDYKNEVTKEATCTEAGVMTYTCIKCGGSYTEEIPALGHDYKSEVTTAATCTEAGVETFTCGNCGEAYTKEIPALGHNYLNGICTHCGELEKPLPILDEKIKIFHSLNLASDISVNFVVPKSLLTGYDMTTVYMECTMDLYSGNEVVGTKTYKLKPTEVGNYYYFVMDQLTAMQMNDRMIAVFYGVKDGKTYYSAEDNYSIADYAYAALNNAAMSMTLKNLCADLLRYGSIAQSYMGYRTNALADSGITEEQKIHLSDLDSVEFGNTNEILQDLANATVSWVGKTLILGSKVSVKYVVNLTNFKGDWSKLNLRIKYTDVMGGVKEMVLTDMEAYIADRNMYSFTFNGLLVAELRTVLSAQVYEGDTPVSVTVRYSPDTYGNSCDGMLEYLCRAIFAYSDSAKAFFVN